MESIISSFTLADYVMIALTIFSVGWGIYTYYKSKTRPNQLKYIPGEFFNIFNSLPGKFKEFDIKYKKESINNNIYYISGKLVVAKGDIDTEDNEIFIELPEGCKWIDVSEDSSSELIKAKFKTDKTSPRKAILTFNKFRNKNHIIINGIIEGHKLSTDIYEKIRFSHEIIKTDDVKVEDKNSFQEKILFLCTAVAIIADIIVLSPFTSSSYYGLIMDVIEVIVILLLIVLAIYWYVSIKKKAI